MSITACWRRPWRRASHLWCNLICRASSAKVTEPLLLLRWSICRWTRLKGMPVSNYTIRWQKKWFTIISNRSVWQKEQRESYGLTARFLINMIWWYAGLRPRLENIATANSITCRYWPTSSGWRKPFLSNWVEKAWRKSEPKTCSTSRAKRLPNGGWQWSWLQIPTGMLFRRCLLSAIRQKKMHCRGQLPIMPIHLLRLLWRQIPASNRCLIPGLLREEVKKRFWVISNAIRIWRICCWKKLHGFPKQLRKVSRNGV